MEEESEEEVREGRREEEDGGGGRGGEDEQQGQRPLGCLSEPRSLPPRRMVRRRYRHNRFRMAISSAAALSFRPRHLAAAGPMHESAP